MHADLDGPGDGRLGLRPVAPPCAERRSTNRRASGDGGVAPSCAATRSSDRCTGRDRCVPRVVHVRVEVEHLHGIAPLRVPRRDVYLRPPAGLSWRRADAAAAAHASAAATACLAVHAHATGRAPGRLSRRAADRSDVRRRGSALRLRWGLLRRYDRDLHERAVALRAVAPAAVTCANQPGPGHPTAARASAPRDRPRPRARRRGRRPPAARDVLLDIALGHAATLVQSPTIVRLAHEAR